MCDRAYIILHHRFRDFFSVAFFVYMVCFNCVRSKLFAYYKLTTIERFNAFMMMIKHVYFYLEI